ncbi:MAG: helix-turn-helix transcriptional regulator [Sphingomonadaceae bacterium]|nr:helix-turn-helix transcriptional regulator [Sphingomonadaceae bacterium]
MRIGKITEAARVGGARRGSSIALEWGCGVDFGSEQLHRWAREQAGEIMSAPMSGGAFRARRKRHGMTLDAAAQALGLSRRTIAYYLSEEQVIPKTVMLATDGYDGREAA